MEPWEASAAANRLTRPQLVWVNEGQLWSDPNQSRPGLLLWRTPRLGSDGQVAFWEGWGFWAPHWSPAHGSKSPGQVGFMRMDCLRPVVASPPGS